MAGTESARQILERLEAPAVELRFLLSRGYRRAHALRFVGERHQLGDRDRNVLERVVFAADEAAGRRARLVGADRLRGRAVAVDGYNVLIGLECVLTGAPLFLADDGVVRDVAGTRVFTASTPAAVAERLCRPVGEVLAAAGAASVEVIFDRQISRSGELAAACRTVLAALGLAAEARTADRADRAVIEAAARAVVCSSDRVIIDAAPEVFDVVRALAEERGCRL
jgi:hypothetical protein